MFDFRPGKSPGLSRNKPQRREPTTNSIQKWLCLSVSSLLHSCHAILLPGGALRDDTKNGCVADYSDSNPGTCSHNCVIPAPPPPPSPLPPPPSPFPPLPSPFPTSHTLRWATFFLFSFTGALPACTVRRNYCGSPRPNDTRAIGLTRTGYLAWTRDKTC